MATKVLPGKRRFKQFEGQVLLGELSLPEVLLPADAAARGRVGNRSTSDGNYYRNDTEATATRGRRNGYRARSRSGEGR